MAIIFDIKQFAIHDGDGIRTTIFFKGCPLRCKWCHNPEGINPAIEKFEIKRIFDDKEIVCKEVIGREISSKELLAEIQKDQLFYNNSNGGGVTFSGGEPLMQIDSLLEILEMCKNNGINTAVDTSGYTSRKNFDRLSNSGLVDLILFDVKAIDNTLHKECTARDNTLIQENLKSLINKSIRTIIRIPYIPIMTFNEQNSNNLITFLTQIKCNNISEITLLPFHDTAKGKYAKYGYEYLMPMDLKSMKKEQLFDMRDKLENLGWTVTIG